MPEYHCCQDGERWTIRWVFGGAVSCGLDGGQFEKRCFSQAFFFLSSGFPRREDAETAIPRWMDASYKFSWLVQLAQLVQHGDSATHPQRPVPINGLGAAQPASSSHLHRLHPILRRLAQPLTAAAGWPQLRPASSVVRSDGTGDSRLVFFLPTSAAFALPDCNCNCGGSPLLRPRRKRIPGAARFGGPSEAFSHPALKLPGRLWSAIAAITAMSTWSFGILDATTDTGGTWDVHWAAHSSGRGLGGKCRFTPPLHTSPLTCPPPHVDQIK